MVFLCRLAAIDLCRTYARQTHGIVCSFCARRGTSLRGILQQFVSAAPAATIAYKNPAPKCLNNSSLSGFRPGKLLN